MALIIKCLLKIIILTFIFFTNIFGQNNFVLDEERSNVLQNIISSDIGVADLNNDGIGDIIIYGYNKIGTQQGLFLNTYSVSSDGEIDTLQMNILNNYFTYIPEDHSSRYIGGDGKISLGDYDRDGFIDVLAHLSLIHI